MNKIALVIFTLGFATSCAYLASVTPPSKPPTPPLPAVTAEIVESKEIKKSESLQPRGIDLGATVKVVAFSSSANQNLPQPIWKSIALNIPDLFLFMGDNVQFSKTEPSSLMEQYHKLDRIPEYHAFREKVPFMATWNDQDYGPKEFLRYWTYVANSISLGQHSVYHAKIIGPKKKQVQIIMLDTRSFRTKADDAKATLLGETQWGWLEEQLKRPAQVRLIVSSIPLIAFEKSANKAANQWSNFPQERQRFFDLLKKTNARNVVVLSGNRHQSSIAKISLKNWGILFDITASPINEPLAIAEEDSSFEGKPSAEESFGLAQIDWHDKKMSLQIRDINNKIMNSVSFKIK